VITEAQEPYAVLSASRGWQRLCGYSRDEVLGKPLFFMQGSATEPDAVRALMRGVRGQTPVSVRLTNYTKSGEPFVHQLSCEPLRDPSGETKCFQATSLVLQAPGEAPTNLAAVVGAMPPICTDAVPPLWPLLGRAVRPDGIDYRAPPRGPPPPGAKPPSAGPAANGRSGARVGLGGCVGGALPRLGGAASLVNQQAAQRCVSDGACSAGSHTGSVLDDDKFDDDFLDWLESSREGSDLGATFISRIETEMSDV
jgi:PAS domain S-box-containing protein